MIVKIESVDNGKRVIDSETGQIIAEIHGIDDQQPNITVTKDAVTVTTRGDREKPTITFKQPLTLMAAYDIIQAVKHLDKDIMAKELVTAGLFAI